MAMALLALSLFGAPAKMPVLQIKNTFPKPPAAAVQALKVTVGKPFSAGYVFIDGKYLPPPYKVERYGTVIRINGCQVTREIVPWNEFVKTQAGVTKTESSESVEEPADEEPESDPEPEEEEEEEEEEEVDDTASTLDDLFDDNPAPKKPAAKKKPVKKSKPKAKKKPAPKASYSFDGNFAPNDKSRALLQKINKLRTKIDKQLRLGGYYFFSSRYSMLTGDSGAAKHLFDKLPEVMKKNSEREAFGAAMRAAGLSYFPISLNDDLFRNRLDYLQLIERRKNDPWQKKLGN